MKTGLSIIFVVISFMGTSCKHKAEKERPYLDSGHQIESTKEFEELSESEREIVSYDLLSLEDKEEYLEENKIEVWYNTKCRIDGTICCRSCTADGDPYRCAETRFSKCNVCGHGKQSHFAQRQ